MISKTQQRNRRHKRIRAKLSGTAEVPRLSVYKSNRFMHVQLIDDEAGKTLAASSSRSVSGKGKLDQAKAAGKEVAKAAKAKKLEKVRFDRGGFIYTGRVKAVAEGAREGGLKF